MENCLRLAGAQNKAEGLHVQFLKFGGPKIERCKFAVYLQIVLAVMQNRGGGRTLQ
jgi:hypothetical protein